MHQPRARRATGSLRGRPRRSRGSQVVQRQHSQRSRLRRQQKRNPSARTGADPGGRRFGPNSSANGSGFASKVLRSGSPRLAGRPTRLRSTARDAGTRPGPLRRMRSAVALIARPSNGPGRDWFASDGTRGCFGGSSWKRSSRHGAAWGEIWAFGSGPHLGMSWRTQGCGGGRCGWSQWRWHGPGDWPGASTMQQS